jgi:hypothetical protein
MHKNSWKHVMFLDKDIQGDSGGEVNIPEGESINHVDKKVHMNVGLILSGYQDRTV